MFYLIYKITNILDGKYYIGAHKTLDKDDGYMGSGVMIKRAIEKYGAKNFKKEILCECSSSSEMYAKEKELVVLSEETYNLKEGGEGGFDYINSNEELRVVKNKKAREITNSRHKDKLSEWARKGGLASVAKHGVQKAFLEEGKTAFLGKTHSEETKKKIGEHNSKAQSGYRNSQFGTMWITNEKDNMKIPKDGIIPTGWRKGRKINAGLV